jgi:lipopolysaccharide transport system permease protein
VTATATTAKATATSVDAVDGAGPPSIDLQGEATSPVRLAKEVWQARQLMLILARKEFHVRYRRAAFGLLWAIGLPLLQSAVMALVFSKVAKIGHAPHYAIFILSGMTAWVYFTAVLTVGSTAVVDGTDISSRVYFPRILMPLVQVVTGLYGYVITLVITLILCPLLGAGLGTSLVLLVPATFLLIALTTGFCLVASALHVYFRDVRYIVTAAVIVWFYVTPIIYPASDAPHVLRSFINFNPMTGVVDLFHAGLLGTSENLGFPVLVSCLWTAALLVVGIGLHCRFNRVFADRL